MRRGLFAGNHGRGSHWIRDEKRRRIYARDGWRCVWCCCALGDARTLAGAGGGGLQLACLDHVLPRASGGGNESHNLVTSCMACNELRGERSAVEWCGTLPNPGEAFEWLLDCLLRPLPAVAAKAAA